MVASDTSTWRHALVLGGIRSGKSEFAESLLISGAFAQVRYVATARRIPGDDDWNQRIDTHRARRPRGWTTTEIGAHPLSLPDLVATATADDCLLIEDLGTWVAGVTEITSADDLNRSVAMLAAATRGCAARLVMVSPEVGLSVIPADLGVRAFADTLGELNRAISGACDRVTLVIAGNAVPVKGGL